MTASISVHAVCDRCGGELQCRPTPVGATPHEWDAAMIDAKTLFRHSGWTLRNKQHAPDGLTTAATCRDCRAELSR